MNVRDLNGIANDRPWTRETVVSMHEWTPMLLTLRTTRDPEFSFVPGQYARVAVLDANGEAVWRPLSIVSAPHDEYFEYLEFLVLRVPEGEFSTALGGLRPGSPFLVEREPLGFMRVDQLQSGRDLWLIGSGSGLGPFVSMLRDPAIWRDFDRLVAVHSVRTAGELAYREELTHLATHGGAGSAQLIYLPVVTREPGVTQLAERVTALLDDGRLEAAACCPIEAKNSRIIVCGNPELVHDLRQRLKARGFAASRRNAPGQMAFERYW